MENEVKPPPREMQLAVDHVDWFLNTIRPLLITNFIHGYKHGLEDKEKERQEDEPATIHR